MFYEKKIYNKNILFNKESQKKMQRNFFSPSIEGTNTKMPTKKNNVGILKTNIFLLNIESVNYVNYEITKIISYGVVLTTFMLFVAIYTGVQSSFYNLNDTKRAEYECGFEPFDFCSRKPFHVHFYLVGILFVLFDVEVSMLYPGAHEFWNMNQIVYHAGQFFIMLILVGVLYEGVKKAIEGKTSYVFLMFDIVAWIALISANLFQGLLMFVFCYDVATIFDNNIPTAGIELDLTLEINIIEKQENNYFLFSENFFMNFFVSFHVYSLILLDQSFLLETGTGIPFFADADKLLNEAFSAAANKETNTKFYDYIFSETINLFCNCKDISAECKNPICHKRKNIIRNICGNMYYWLVAVLSFYSISYFVEKTYLFFKNIFVKNNVKKET